MSKGPSGAVVLLALLALAFFIAPSVAQSVAPLDKIQNQQELDRAGAALDTALFDSYNKCDLEKFASFFVNDVEFYHDQGGVTLGRAALTDSVKKNICGKVTRELVPGSLKVFYMKGYGLLETDFTIQDMKTRKVWVKDSSFICGSTRTGRGRLRG